MALYISALVSVIKLSLQRIIRIKPQTMAIAIIPNPAIFLICSKVYANVIKFRVFSRGIWQLFRKYKWLTIPLTQGPRWETLLRRETQKICIRLPTNALNPSRTRASHAYTSAFSARLSTFERSRKGPLWQTY